MQRFCVEQTRHSALRAAWLRCVLLGCNEHLIAASWP